MTFIGHFPLFSLLSPFAPQDTKPTEPFSVNSLIRKTLTPIVLLHFGGKNISLIFFSPAAIESGWSCERLCAGLDSAGGFRKTCEVLRVRMRVEIRGIVTPCRPTSYPFSPSERFELWRNSPGPPAPTIYSAQALQGVRLQRSSDKHSSLSSCLSYLWWEDCVCTFNQNQLLVSSQRQESEPGLHF